MSGPDKDRADDLHEAGQKDGAQPFGSYDPPHGVIETLIGDTETCTRENAIYDSGFHNAREQK